MGDSMLKEEKCCKGVRAPPTPENSENKFCSFDIPCMLTLSVFFGFF